MRAAVTIQISILFWSISFTPELLLLHWDFFICICLFQLDIFYIFWMFMTAFGVVWPHGAMMTIARDGQQRVRQEKKHSGNHVSYERMEIYEYDVPNSIHSPTTSKCTLRSDARFTFRINAHRIFFPVVRPKISMANAETKSLADDIVHREGERWNGKGDRGERWANGIRWNWMRGRDWVRNRRKQNKVRTRRSRNREISRLKWGIPRTRLFRIRAQMARLSFIILSSLMHCDVKHMRSDSVQRQPNS